MNKLLTINQYKRRFPGTSETPTLSQTGDVARLLAAREKRLQQRAEKEANRRDCHRAIEEFKGRATKFLRDLIPIPSTRSHDPAASGRHVAASTR